MDPQALIRLLYPDDVSMDSRLDCPAFSEEFINWLQVYDPKAIFESRMMTTRAPIKILMLELLVNDYSWANSEQDTFVFSTEEIFLLFKLTWC